MLSLNDIKNLSLETTRGGYRKEGVEEFVSQVVELVTALENEKADMQKKIVILAEKIEEYKRDEENIKQVLVGAQRMAEQTKKEAEETAEMLINDARERANGIVGEATRQISANQEELARVKKEVGDFKARILALYKEHLELISKIPYDDSEPSAPVAEVKPAPQEEPQQEKAAPAPQQEEPAAEPAQPSFTMPPVPDNPGFSAGFIFHEED